MSEISKLEWIFVDNLSIILYKSRKYQIEYYLILHLLFYTTIIKSTKIIIVLKEVFNKLFIFIRNFTHNR